MSTRTQLSTTADPVASAESPIVIVGAGPAGLTAAYELSRRGVPALVFEKDLQVGGIARTVEYKGFRFDIGGHRFFTKVPAVSDLWRAVLGRDFLKRPRLSRIYYNGRFFDYPLKPFNTLFNLGIFTSIGVLASYSWSVLFPIKPEVSFADWVSNRFGRRLFNIFFKTYTEKVWGIPSNTIGAQWAAQRIKGLSLKTAVINMLRPHRFKSGDETIKTLIDEFEYPRLGPGMMWEAFRDKTLALGGRVELGWGVTRIRHALGRVTALEAAGPSGHRSQAVSHLISTMPLRHLIWALDPPAPAPVQQAANQLKYRDFLTVALIVDRAEVFPDNWIYVHDEAVKVGRIQNFKNWSPEMVPNAHQTCLGLEYFCFEGDGLWSLRDEELIALGTRELEAVGLADQHLVVDGAVVRMPKAYPVYDEGYEEALAVVRDYLESFDNLQVIGRNGMHKYNNQDHSMLTAILAVRNLCGEQFDIWAVNADDEYHEEQSGENADPVVKDILDAAKTQPLVPRATGKRHARRSETAAARQPQS
jgi:protoporphyrinogen oxidase